MKVITFSVAGPSLWNRLPSTHASFYYPISLLPYHFLKLVCFLGANRTKSASVGPRPLRTLYKYLNTIPYKKTNKPLAVVTCIKANYNAPLFDRRSCFLYVG